jgi:hypothetical protein
VRLWLVVLMLAQSPNPFPNHETPPKGWMCRPATSEHEAQTVAKACVCLGMSTNPECQPMNEAPKDDPKCRVYCHRDHCGCVVNCEQ